MKKKQKKKIPSRKYNYLESNQPKNKVFKKKILK